jgi:hypothetical protein
MAKTFDLHYDSLEIRRQGAALGRSTRKKGVMAKTMKKGRAAVHVEVAAPKKAAENGRKAADGESPAGVENLDKVRDILFGSQMRDNERRFSRLEERMLKETADLRDETRKRLESLEAYQRKEMQTLLERLKSEQMQRTDAIKEVAQEMKEMNKSLQQRALELADLAAESTRELRQEILDQSKTLRDELQAMRVDASNEIDQAAAELRGQKLDKATLSDMFTEMAARLGEQAE